MEEIKNCECPPTMPLIGQKAPAFKAVTTNGEINFPNDYKDRWVILFSHPADFTPVCTTEFMTFAEMMDEFNALNTDLIGLSIDSVYAHIAWLRKIEELEWNGISHPIIKFPVIADITMEIAKKYGMMHAQSETNAVRAVFFIDPKHIIRAMLYYPASLGRNFKEIKRILLSLQKTDSEGVSTPANWKPGEDTIIGAPLTHKAARDRLKLEHPDDRYCLDWFLSFKKADD